MERLLRDLRQALRALARTPSYAAVTVAVLAVALGATTAIFGAVHGVLLKRLPYRDPDRLVFLWERAPSFPEMSVSYPDYRDWRERQRSFEELGIFRIERFNLSGLDRAERLEGLRFSAEMLKVLGVEPALGRGFAPEEDRAGGAPVAMVTHAFWRERLGGSPAALGRTLLVDGVPHQLVGVLPEGFRFAFRSFSLVVPSGQVDPKQVEDRGNHAGFYALGRLRPGVSLAQARSDMEGVGRSIGEAYPDDAKELVPALMPLRDRLVRDARTLLLLLMAAGVFVLLVAIANAANLALARGLARTREMAIRAALGAGRPLLVRQVLVEGALLGLASGAAGLLLASWGVDLLASARPTSVAADAIALDPAVFAFGFAVALASGLAAAAAPALLLSEPRLHEVLKATDLGGGGHLGRLRGALVVAEVALACVLVAGAGLSVRALLRLESGSPGFRTADVLSLSVNAPAARYRTPDEVRGFHRDVLQAVRGVPGVRSAALSRGLPLGGMSETSFAVAGRPPPEVAERPFAVSFATSPGFLETMGIPLLEGRALDDRDRVGGAPAVLVDEVLARKFFPDGRAVGQRLTSTDGQRAWEIVGVVPHVKVYGMSGAEAAPYQIHWALQQSRDQSLTTFAREVTVVARTAGPPLAAAEAIRRAVAAVDPDVPVYLVRPMDELVRRSLGSERFAAGLFLAFGAIAVLLAAVGLYAVMAQSVARRTHEIGVRMALGAQPSAVQRLVVGEALRLVGLGLVLGLAGAVGVGRLLGGVVAGAGTFAPGTLAAAAAGLLAVAALATWLPARRATLVDPTVALREG